MLLLSFSYDSSIVSRRPPGISPVRTLFSSDEWLTPLVRSLTLAAWTAMIAVPLGLARSWGSTGRPRPGGASCSSSVWRPS